MTKEELEQLEKMTLEKVTALMKTEVLPTSLESVSACVKVLEFCRDYNSPKESTTFETDKTAVPASGHWKLIPKMKLICKRDTFDVNGSYIGKTATLLPGGILPDSNVYWYVKFEEGQVIDQCSEEYVRDCFDPVPCVASLIRDGIASPIRDVK